MQTNFYETADPMTAGLAGFLHLWLIDRATAWLQVPAFTSWFEGSFLASRENLQRELQSARQVIARLEARAAQAARC